MKLTGKYIFHVIKDLTYVEFAINFDNQDVCEKMIAISLYSYPATVPLSFCEHVLNFLKKSMEDASSIKPGSHYSDMELTRALDHDGILLLKTQKLKGDLIVDHKYIIEYLQL